MANPQGMKILAILGCMQSDIHNDMVSTSSRDLKQVNELKPFIDVANSLLQNEMVTGGLRDLLVTFVAAPDDQKMLMRSVLSNPEGELKKFVYSHVKDGVNISGETLMAIKQLVQGMLDYTVVVKQQDQGARVKLEANVQQALSKAKTSLHHP